MVAFLLPRIRERDPEADQLLFHIHPLALDLVAP